MSNFRNQWRTLKDLKKHKVSKLPKIRKSLPAMKLIEDSNNFQRRLVSIRSVVLTCMVRELKHFQEPYYLWSLAATIQKIMILLRKKLQSMIRMITACFSMIWLMWVVIWNNLNVAPNEPHQLIYENLSIKNKLLVSYCETSCW